MLKKTIKNTSKNVAVEKMLLKHPRLVHSENMKVVSHVQRDDKDWSINTLMIRGVDVPFIFKRKKKYQNLNGSLLNLTYYPEIKMLAGIEFEIMKVVRIKVS